ncbi:MAG: type II toxin-antitoxin system PemK/MazF family toxin [Myxococcales bacterium]|nr:type II toxin-antitoxin system PemK/MazF family toxin [Myxococcales bacterium]
MTLKRGDIWVVDFGRGVGTEIGGKETNGVQDSIRPAVIVSSDRYNDVLQVTVVPVMNYDERYRELSINWGFKLTKKRVIEHPRNRVHRKLYYDYSFVDCGQLSTIFAIPPNFPGKNSLPAHIETELLWDYPCGTLREEFLLRLDNALQMVVGGDTIVGDLRDGSPVYGDVVEIRGGNHLMGHYLVISSTGIDALRESIKLSPPNPETLNHITVIPISYKDSYDPDEALNQVPGISLVHVQWDNQIGRELWMANCTSINTFDRVTRSTKVVGHVTFDDMRWVAHRVRQYLDLPPLRLMPTGFPLGGCHA